MAALTGPRRTRRATQKDFDRWPTEHEEVAYSWVAFRELRKRRRYVYLGRLPVLHQSRGGAESLGVVRHSRTVYSSEVQSDGAIVGEE